MADDERAELEKTEGHTLNDHRLVEEAAKLRELYAKRAGPYPAFLILLFIIYCLVCLFITFVQNSSSWWRRTSGKRPRGRSRRPRMPRSPTTASPGSSRRSSRVKTPWSGRGGSTPG